MTTFRGVDVSSFRYLLLQESVYIREQLVRFIIPHKQGNTSHHFFNKTSQHTEVTGWENRRRNREVGRGIHWA